MRLNFIIILGICIAVLLWSFFYVVTPLEKLNAGETSVCVAFGLVVAMVVERITRPKAQSSTDKNKRRKS